MTPSTHLFKIVFNINAVQYETGPTHEPDNHIFAKIPGGVWTPGPPLWIRACFGYVLIFIMREKIIDKQTINPFPNKPFFLRVCMWYKSFEKTEGKGEIACNEQFLLFPQCFLTIWRTFSHFHQIQNCPLKTLSVWKSLQFVVWERVKLTGTVCLC